MDTSQIVDILTKCSRCEIHQARSDKKCWYGEQCDVCENNVSNTADIVYALGVAIDTMLNVKIDNGCLDFNSLEELWYKPVYLVWDDGSEEWGIVDSWDESRVYFVVPGYTSRSVSKEEYGARCKAYMHPRDIKCASEYDEDVGLRNKYIILDAETLQEITDGFVLRPEIDDAALIALNSYAAQCLRVNPKLSHDLVDWICRIWKMRDESSEEHEKK